MGSLIWRILVALLVVVGLSYLLGINEVLYTHTIGKWKQDAQREVFEQTQSFTRAQKTEALKYFREYNKAETDDEKRAIKAYVRERFTMSDVEKMEESPVSRFIRNALLE